MSKTRSFLIPSFDLLDRGFGGRAKKAAEWVLPVKVGIDRKFRARLRQSGFDSSVAALLVGVTPGTAIEFAAGGGMRQFRDAVESGGSQLARRNISPNRIAAALRDYAILATEALKDSPAALNLKPTFDQLQFAIILILNDAFYRVRESETEALVGLYGADADALDAYAILRKLVESMATVFGASAGHIFVLDSEKKCWELRASTAIAVSPLAEASIAANAALIKKLGTVFEVSSGRTQPKALLDPGWHKQWPQFWSVPIQYAGEIGGVIQLAFSERRPVLPRDSELISIAGKLSLANAKRTRMIEDIAEREQQMFDLARRMLQVEEIERRRISRELHDDAGQSLVVIRLQMEMIETSMPPDAEWRERLAEARDLTETTILHMRRLIADLSPAVLEQLGLAAGLRQLVNRLRQAHHCKVHLHIGKLPPLFSDFQIVVYRLAQECLTNISKHSQAKRVNISVTVVDRVLRLRVEDDGVGFDVEEGLGRKHCFGLTGMRERVTLLGGNCQIRSTTKGGEVPVHTKKTGTEMDIQLPIPLNSPSSFT